MDADKAPHVAPVLAEKARLALIREATRATGNATLSLPRQKRNAEKTDAVGKGRHGGSEITVGEIKKVDSGGAAQRC